MTFNKANYLSKTLWLSDDWLMKPDGSKKCRVCETQYYSIEFIDYAQYIDGCLPVCKKCLRSTSKGVLNRSIIDESGFTVKCGKCDTVVGLGQMGMSYSSNKVSNFCWNCTKGIFKKIWGTEMVVYNNEHIPAMIDPILPFGECWNEENRKEFTWPQ